MSDYDYDEVEQELEKLRQQLKKFRISGSGSHGSFEQGFVIGGEGEETPPTNA